MVEIIILVFYRSLIDEVLFHTKLPPFLAGPGLVPPECIFGLPRWASATSGVAFRLPLRSLSEVDWIRETNVIVEGKGRRVGHALAIFW